MKLEVMQQGLKVVGIAGQVAIAVALGAWAITRVARRRRTA
jgi:hypothetical protein